jgi:hypothetical protein
MVVYVLNTALVNLATIRKQACHAISPHTPAADHHRPAVATGGTQRQPSCPLLTIAILVRARLGRIRVP